MQKILNFILLFFVAGMLHAQEAPEGLFIGSKAPDFKFKDSTGKEIRLKDQLKKGKVVLVFYRGQWCPFCNRELSRLADSFSLIQAKGATVIAVTPELPENVDKTREKTKVSFPIVSDEGLKIMKAYDVDFEVPENTVTRYKNAGIDLVKNNGPNGNYLPVPAAYVIDKEATVVYRFFDTDYKKRPWVADIMAYLN